MNNQLTPVDPRFLDHHWPTAKGLLEPAVETNEGEEDIAQLRARIAYGGAVLVLWGETAAAVVEFKQHPNYRSAWVAYLGGTTDEAFWLAFRDWASRCGASVVESLCGDSQARLFARYGMRKTYNMMRFDI